MAMPTVTKTWQFSVNNRITFVSVNDAAAQVMYRVKNFLVATVGWTVKYTCDGVTGPTSSSDHTDRWASAANANTRGAAAGNAQSFAVLTNAQGLDVLLTYQGSSDDIFRVSMSPSGAFTPAGTSNQQPTATDEVIGSNAYTMVNSGASGDRILHMMASNDKHDFRVFLYKGGGCIGGFGIQEVVSSVASTYNFSPPMFIYNLNSAAISLANAAALAGGPLAAQQTAGAVGARTCRIASTNLNLGGGGRRYNNSTPTVFTNANPELQGAAPVIDLYVACNQSNLNGEVGKSIDVWLPYCNGITDGDTFSSSQYMYMQCHLWPWDGSSSLTTT